MNKEFGQISFKNKTVWVQQEPYLAESGLYTALGEDDDGKKYKIERELDRHEEWDIVGCKTHIHEFYWDDHTVTPYL